MSQRNRQKERASDDGFYNRVYCTRHNDDSDRELVTEMKDTLTRDMENMLKIMDRTVDRADIWQDRFIYWIAVAIYHILVCLKRNN